MVWKKKRVHALIILVLSVFLSAHAILWTRKPMHAVEYTPPLSFKGWEGREAVYNRELLTSWLGTDRIVFRNYEDSSRRYAVTLYVAYYPEMGASDKAHAPEVCYPGQGWIIRENGIIDLTFTNRRTSVKRLVVKKEKQEEIVYSWWQTSRSQYAHNSRYRLEQIFSSLISKDTSSIWVRVSTDVVEDRKVKSEEALQVFCYEVAPILDQYFPHNNGS